MTLSNDIESAINCNSGENGSNTPDFILADYLMDCLVAFDKAVNAREKWYGRTPTFCCNSVATLIDTPTEPPASEVM